MYVCLVQNFIFYSLRGNKIYGYIPIRSLGKNILFSTIAGVVGGIAMAPLLMLTGILAKR
jgi:hypothetical protein